MKKILFLFLVTIFMVSCSEKEKEVFNLYDVVGDIEVTYMNGDTDTISFELDSLTSVSLNIDLKEGDLNLTYNRIYDGYTPKSWRSYCDEKTLASGVRIYNILTSKRYDFKSE